MDISTIFYYLFGIVSVSYILHLGFYLTGASLYDIWQLQRTRRINDGYGASYVPLVTVLVPAHNEEAVIVRCLNSILNNTYKRVKIIVVDDASTDNTYKVLRDFKREHPNIALRIIRKRVNGGKGAGLNYALRRYVDGELVMTLDADSILSSNSIDRAVSYFVDPKIMGVAANVQIMNQHTTLSILQKFEHMIGYRSKKVYTLTNCEFVVGGVASTYRMSALRDVQFYDTDTLTEDIGLSTKIVAQGNRDHRVVYGVDVMAMTEPVDSFRGLLRQRYRWKYGSLQNLFKYNRLIGSIDRRFTVMLTQYRMPVAVVSEVVLFLLPIMWLYAIYLTITQHSILLVMGAYVTVTAYVFVTLWQDEHIRFKERIYLTIYAPIAYFIFYIMDLIQVIAILKCSLKIRRLARHENIGSTWTSPRRIGKHMEIAAGGRVK